MKYLVIGAGGTGGSVGALLTKAGKDVTMIARGKHCEAMQENGLCDRWMHLYFCGNLRAGHYFNAQ